MLDIGWSELVIIGVVALVVVGPKELPSLLRTTGQWVGKARRMAADFQGQINEAIREAELDDVKKSVEDLRSLSPTKLITDQLTAIGDEVKAVGATAENEFAKLGAGHFATMPGEAGASMSGFMEATDTPPVSSANVEAMIDAAATPVADLPPPVFDVTPAPPLVAEAPAAEPVAIASADPVEAAAAPAEKKAAEA